MTLFLFYRILILDNTLQEGVAMFLSNDELTLELIGIFKIKRTQISQHSDGFRSYDSLSIRLSGESEFKFNNKSEKVTPNNLLYLPHNAKYSQKTSSETIIAIHFINYSHSSDGKPEVINLDDSEKIHNLVLEMYDIWNLKEAGYKYKCTSLLYNLLYLLRKQYHEHSIRTVTSDVLMRDALKYIHQNYKNQRIYISELAKMISVSEVYFRKIFKKMYSVSPGKYIINLRLEYASQLLQSNLYSVSEASENSGFNDVKYFSRCFKEKFGMTPMDFKHQNLEKRFK